ncbi:hypothetical protein CHLRE_07g332275v5 [Chlamydomonas reinhardtii]|uniref:Uncharacterized protein n=1 Tax=Chlamydomonas reinhardtii TaxID=3055 RepID=A0A2K3DK08_CHLRE|nr:uncharacterized protein CHLRE_07g332275v5 [Chlamydomonas reinhardtii]PNW80853.1 hypothetical protein CHLRE_07g332275v5 [Chlamydomonas reinhardtii]
MGIWGPRHRGSQLPGRDEWKAGRKQRGHRVAGLFGGRETQASHTRWRPAAWGRSERALSFLPHLPSAMSQAASSCGCVSAPRIAERRGACECNPWGGGGGSRA